MTLTLFVVCGNNNGDNLEPEIFTNHKDAYNFIVDEFYDHGKRWGYDKEDINCSLQELKEKYNDGDFDYFYSYLGELDMTCYRREIRI